MLNKKRFTIIILLVLMVTKLFSNEIEIINDESKNEKTTISFISDEGVNIPLYKPLGQSTNMVGNNLLIVTQLEYLADAPVTFSVNNGYYEFQMYMNSVGAKKFNLNANGGEQIWKLKPIGKMYKPAYWASFAGGMGVFLSGAATAGTLYTGLGNSDAAIACLIGSSTLTITSVIIRYLTKASAVRVN